jgi:hypothetical protein
LQLLYPKASNNKIWKLAVEIHSFISFFNHSVMQFKFKFASLFTLMMVFFLSTAQNIMAQKSLEMAQKSLEPADAIQIAPRGAISL